ncbi:MAG: hypothetical protein R3336_10310, partial [Phycisphaeraceae bacterium]|nr:hypothetical protein [Phycisphaeraceae bacterium]
RPLRPAPSLTRVALGWALCGLLIAGAVTVAGPQALIAPTLVIGIILTLCPDRVSHLLGLLAALLLAAVVLLPWVLTVFQHEPSALGPLSATFLDIFRGEGLLEPGALAHRTAMIPLMAAPWTIWLAGGLVQPFSTSSAGVRTRMFLGWAWFITACVIVVFMPGDALVARLMLIPGTGLVVGQLFRQYGDLAGQGRVARLWRLLRWPHLAMLLAASVAGPMMLEMPAGPTVDSQSIVELLTSWQAVAAGGGLLLAMASFHAAEKHRPERAMILWAIWALLAVAILLAARADQLPSEPSHEPAGRRLAAVAGDRPIYRLAADKAESQAPLPPTLILFARRPIPTISPHELDEARKQYPRLLLVTARNAPTPVGGARPAATFDTLNLTAWHLDPPSDPSSEESTAPPQTQPDPQPSPPTTAP